MEQRLKERLIGAAILVALAVWLIPWVLDGQAPPANHGGPVPLQLPAPKAKAPERTQTINLDVPSQASTVVAANEAGAPAGGGASPPSATGQAADTAAGTATDAAAPQKHRAAPQSTSSPAPSPAPAQSTAEPQWVVQLGSFGEQDNAQRLAKRVAGVGFDANISSYRSDGQVLYRVRIGPKPSRNAAEAVASALSAHGFVAQVVTAD